MTCIIKTIPKLVLIAFAFVVTSFALDRNVADAVTLDFEGFAAGQIIDNEYSALGVAISAENFTGPDLAVVFDSDHYTGGDNDLAAPFLPGPSNSGGSASPGKILIIQENACNGSCSNPDDEGDRPAGIFTIAFDMPVFLGSVDFFDIEWEEDQETDDNRILLYGAGGLMPVDFWTPHTGDHKWDRVDINTAGVTQVEIRMGGSGAIDNIAFSVPEPSSLLLLSIGLAGAAVLRRKFTT
jgi:hypothetical protein